MNCLSLPWTAAAQTPRPAGTLARALEAYACSNPGESSGMSSRGGGSPRLETLPAEHRAPLCGTEGHSGFLAALGAGGASLDLGVMEVLARRGRRTWHTYTVGLAGFAGGGFVPEVS